MALSSRADGDPGRRTAAPIGRDWGHPPGGMGLVWAIPGRTDWRNRRAGGSDWRDRRADQGPGNRRAARRLNRVTTLAAAGMNRRLPVVSAPAVLRHPACWLLPALPGRLRLASRGPASYPLRLGRGQLLTGTARPWPRPACLRQRRLPGRPRRVGGQYQYGLWHPPLYLYTLGLGFRLFGASEATARGVGVVLMGLTAILVYSSDARPSRRPPASGARCSPWGSSSRARWSSRARSSWTSTARCSRCCSPPGRCSICAWEDVRGPSATAAGARRARRRSSPWPSGPKLTTPFFLLGVVLVYQMLRGRPLRGLPTSSASALAAARFSADLGARLRPAPHALRHAVRGHLGRAA